ncbi:uncharacterized protein BJ212DRAFT_1388427 [Suillus subaureus]|uniref:Roadblock/LAMTOR2 domain-containing protein n=1 Tax=Suillus subaureus TaxID=48587 RepID=A0A9P7J7Q7_9AGAM|nr:uncharacterized protein BJ212DRAFT_1388427 [Suillus subaureus]KAG1806970.1 hypothetical protein BJ212DRAFT_1388427 [Suillus subaureus]
MAVQTITATTSTNITGATHNSTLSIMPPELEQTLALLSSHRSVLGYLLLSRGDHGEQGKKYASVIGKMVESVQAGLEEVSGSENDGDQIRFMRIRTKRHEIMISPDERYLLAVLHDPAS